ncbi:hypothetical protein ACFYNY_20585 [Streptomyces sp. NPDC006530]|uniref:hypothetical protein n=1 Tax=Streptomyces sp. NPDC006530 TaxID=3364750 RepID=UPI00369D565D
MSFSFGRRVAMLATAAAMSVGALTAMTGTASADDVVPLTTSNWVGLYNSPDTTHGKISYGDVPPGGRLWAHCWTRGQQIGNWGNTWYQVSYVDYGQGWVSIPTAYVFAGYADNNAHSVNRDPYITPC